MYKFIDFLENSASSSLALEHVSNKTFKAYNFFFKTLKRYLIMIGTLFDRFHSQIFMISISVSRASKLYIKTPWHIFDMKKDNW